MFHNLDFFSKHGFRHSDADWELFVQIYRMVFATPPYPPQKHLCVTICCPAKIHFITMTILTARVDGKWGGNNPIPPPSSLSLFVIGSPLGPRVTMTLFRGRATNPEERVTLWSDSEPKHIQEPLGSCHPSASSLIRTVHRVEREEEARRTSPTKGSLRWVSLLSWWPADLCELSAVLTDLSRSAESWSGSEEPQSFGS